MKKIFRENSTSYYYSSLLFQEDIREDVFKLYAYFRTVDSFVDEPPQDEEELERYRELTLGNWEEGKTGEEKVDMFLEVARENDFEREWVKAFYNSMEMDTYKEEYESMEETLEYIHGAAEVVGYMMVNVLGLDEDAREPAALFGRAMQYCNFLRDIEEDKELGRRYLPEEELEKYDLESLEKDEIEMENFYEFMEAQVNRYFEWQEKAEKGFHYIPYRVRVPVILSSRIYKYTAKRIRRDPERVFEEKVRPSRLKIFEQFIISLGGRK